ncbi:hypothetical protein H5410_029581 [Solanum commersonii]|uniref:Uncharacterized protein n=1 Tax=Solanum commersonii TaxID=4109 RepID=A0A9J5YBW8_SOLCO|nr:hypothetical protein H5410_029581 [Solanum commersonii]
MSDSSFFDLDEDKSTLIAEDIKLENLRFLETVMLSYSKDTEHIFKRFPNLQVLGFDTNESWDYSTKKFWFPKLDCLTELEELTVRFAYTRGFSPATNRPWNFNFPLRLKKLRLYDFRLTSDSLSTIARLPNLEVLSLYRTIIQGGEWNMGEEDTFENLKCLTLNKVTLAKWERCCKLEEIPPSFKAIGSLKIIKLVECPQLEDSVMKIKEYANDMRGGDELQIRPE